MARISHKGDAMNTIHKPSKEAVRNWLASAIVAHQPPPSPERIREMLGWNLVADDKKAGVR